MTTLESIYGETVQSAGGRSPASSPTRPDLDGLREVLRCVEEAPIHRFRLSSFKCGTKACAIGWFCLMNPDDPMKLFPLSEISDYAEPRFEGTGFGAVAARFRISGDDASYLFNDGNDCEPYSPANGPRDREELIERLTDFIERHDTPNT